MPKGKKTGGRDFQKGNCANPFGRPKQKHETTLLQRALRDELVSRTVELLLKPRAELEKMSKDPRTNGLDNVIIGVLRVASIKGSSSKFDVLMNRVLGKVKDVIQFEGGEKKNPIQVEILSDALTKILCDDKLTEQAIKKMDARISENKI